MMQKYEVVFIPVSDVEAYSDYEMSCGYGLTDQIRMEDGILVKKSDEEMFKKNVDKFTKWLNDSEE